jgi:hypothetical protein
MKEAQRRKDGGVRPFAKKTRRRHTCQNSPSPSDITHFDLLPVTPNLADTLPRISASWPAHFRALFAQNDLARVQRRRVRRYAAGAMPQTRLKIRVKCS